MFNKNDFAFIGNIGKPHGINGQLNVTFSSDLFDQIDVPEFLFLEIEGYLVPFRTEELRLTLEDAGIIKFEDIENDKAGRNYSGLKLFIEKKELEDEELPFTPDQLVGFTLKDTDKNTVGTVSDFVDNAFNPLLIVDTTENNEVMIPFAMELIADADLEQKILIMQIPEGLLDLE